MSVASPLYSSLDGWSWIDFGGVAAAHLPGPQARVLNSAERLYQLGGPPQTQSAPKLLFFHLKGFFFPLQASIICELMLPKLPRDFQISQ